MVTGIYYEELLLGQKTRGDTRCQHGIVLNPTGVLRQTNPANLASVDDSGKPLWVLPVSFQRVALAATDPATEGRFNAAWAMLDEALCSVLSGNIPCQNAQIWAPGYSVGSLGVELRKQPDLDRHGHPWVALLRLPDTQLQLLCPLSDRESRRGSLGRYQASFEGRDLLAGQGSPVTGPVTMVNDALQPKAGVVELNHFAVLDPEREGWTRMDAFMAGSRVRNVLKRFCGWPQRACSGCVEC